MSHARRYHEPGVGSRTGMRMADGALDLDEFFQAGRRALIGSPRRSIARSSISSISSRASSGLQNGVRQTSKDGVTGSSTMVIEQSPAPSPRSTIRQSIPAQVGSSSFAYDRTHDKRELSMANYSRRRSPRKEMSAESGLSAERPTPRLRIVHTAAVSARNSNAREEQGPSSPSPLGSEVSVLMRRKGLNAGLEARMVARLRQQKETRDSSVRSSISSRPAGMGQEESAVMDLTASPELRSSAAGSESDAASITSWSSPKAIPLANDLDDIQAFDGSELPSSRASLASVEEEQVSDAGPNEHSHDGNTQDVYVVRGNRKSEEFRSSSFQAESVSLAQDDATSVDYEAFAPDDQVSDAEPEEVSAPSESESEAESTMTGNYNAEDVEEYAFEDNDDPDITPTVNVSRVDQLETMSSVSAATASERSKSVRRSVLSERDVNMPRSSLLASQSAEEKGEKASMPKSKTKKRTAIPQEHNVWTKRPNTRTEIVEGMVVERIPSSHHRRTAAGAHEEEAEGIRRSTRYRYKPLEYWRGERARFGRLSLPTSKENVDDGTGANGSVGDDTIDADAFEDHVMAAPPPVAVLKEIIRIPRAEGEGTFSGLKIPKKKDGVTDAKRKVRRRDAHSAEPDLTQPTRHAEDGWDKDTSPSKMVMDPMTGEETEKQIACTSAQLRPRMAVGCTFGFEKVFVVEDFMATGVLFLLVEGQKPLKNSKDNYYTFTVLEGCVRVCVHQAEFTIAPLGMFFVPRGNDYSIQNISKRVARLAFTQAKSPAGRSS